MKEETRTTHLQQAQQKLAQNWNLSTGAGLPFDRQSLEDLLAPALLNMLTDHFEELTQMMYRFDVPEQQFHAALAAPTLKEAAQSLAAYLIDRELQKIETRAIYAQGQNETQ